jgi:hypothetical protein
MTTRIVQLNAEDRATVLRLHKLREEREARFQDLLRRYCEAVYVRRARADESERDGIGKYLGPSLKTNI